jgi:hypothetical protein
MSTSRRITRLAAATALGVVLAGTVAAPAFAEDTIGVGLSGVPSSFTAGGRADSFTVSLRNNSSGPVTNVTMRFTVSLNGLTSSQVRIRIGGADLPMQDSGPGQVVAADPRSHDFLLRGMRTEIGYSIEFLTGAPSGRANFTATAFSGKVLGTASDSIAVKGAGVAPSPTQTTPVPTDPASPDNGVVANPSSIPTGPLADNSTHIPDDGSGGIPIGLYIMGAVLVGVGGVILWLLFKQRPAAVASADLPTGEYDQAPPTLGYPAARATVTPPRSSSLAPTAQLPALRGSVLPGPAAGPNRGQPPAPPAPVDPWASQGGDLPPRHSAD